MTSDLLYPRHAKALLDTLDGAFRFCRSLGLDALVKTGRFAEHQKRITRLVALLDPDEHGMIASPIPREAFDTYVADSIAVTECLEFCFSIPYLATLPSPLVTQKLRLVLGEPSALADESAESNQSRNILFETHLAARAWRADLTTHLGPVSDVICDFQGRHLFIECKRPLWAKRLRRRIRGAEEQLRRHLDVALPESRGVIAISLSRLLNPGALIFTMRNPPDGQRVFEAKVQTLAEKCAGAWSRLNRRIIGILFMATVSALDPPNVLFATAHHSLGYSLADRNTPDDNLFRDFHDMLSSVVPF